MSSRALTTPNSHQDHILYSLCCVCAQVVQPDVVLVTFDALASDVSQLQPIAWEAVVVDERNQVQPSLAKAHQALRELPCNFRLQLAAGDPTMVRHHNPILCLVPLLLSSCTQVLFDPQSLCIPWHSLNCVVEGAMLRMSRA